MRVGGAAIIPWIVIAWQGASFAQTEKEMETETAVEDAAIEHLNVGHRLYAAGEMEKAVEEFTRARDLVPRRATPYRWLGMAKAAMGRCQDAIADLDVFRSLARPGDPRLVEVSALRDRCGDPLSPRVETPAAEVRPQVPLVPVVATVAPVARVLSSAEGTRRPIYRRWPLWVGVAGAVVAVGAVSVTAAVALQPMLPIYRHTTPELP